VLTRTLVGHDSGVWGLCLVGSGGDRLVNTTKNKPKAAKREKTRNHSRDVKVEEGKVEEGKVEEGIDASLKKQKKHRKPSSTQDVDTSSSMHALQAGLAGIDLQANLDGSDGMHVMPSESLESLVSPAMRIALGLDVSTTTDSEPGDSGVDDSHHREDEEAALLVERQNLPGKGGAITTLEEDDLLGTTGDDQGKYLDKPSNMCFSSQGWGQPNSLIVSGGCDKVVRVWDVQSG
jgi:F-box and WD-40 domain protein CDC4